MVDKDRREAIKTISTVVGGVITIIALPERWVRPVVDAIVTPAHAQTSNYTPPRTTTTTTTTSTTTTYSPL